jgi:imidazolonepropionase
MRASLRAAVWFTSPVPRPGALRVPSLVTSTGPAPRRGPDLGEPLAVRDAALAWDARGLLTYAGPAGGLPPGGPEPEETGGVAVPGFVDCHTHLPFAGWRADEWEARLSGRTYRDQHGEGGIGRSARMLAQASDEEVLAFSRELVAEMAATGTTAVEFKTGYGLSVEAELRQARLARRLSDEADAVRPVTLLACHAVPSGIDREAWVRAACEELIPATAAEGLADAVDVYVEDIAFSVDDLRRVASAARAHGIGAVRCHADQLGPSRAAEAAVEAGARAADHLNHVSEAGIAALGGSATVAVLLPASTFSLRERPAPARALVEAGAAVAVATDLNPGTSPVSSMPEAMAMACTLYGLTPLEALTAATLNAAAALGLDLVVGSLEPGKRADVALLDVDDVREVPYRPGRNPVMATFVAGEPVAGPP